MSRIRARYRATTMTATFVLAVLASLPFGLLFVLLVHDTTPAYKAVQLTAVALLFVSYLWGPKYADRLFARDSEGL